MQSFRTATVRANRPRTALLGACAAVAAVSTLTACTSSGSTTNPSQSPTASSTGPTSSVPGTPTNTTQSGGAKANPLVYPNVTKAQAKQLERIAVRAPGVQSVGYVPATKRVEIYLDKSVNVKQRVVIARVVKQILHPVSVPTPSKSSKHH